MNRIIEYRHADFSTATVSLKVFEDATQGLHCVIRSLPAGMDIGPDIWRFEKAGNAEKHFSRICQDIESRGFKVSRDVTV